MVIAGTIFKNREEAENLQVLLEGYKVIDNQEKVVANKPNNNLWKSEQVYELS